MFVEVISKYWNNLGLTSELGVDRVYFNEYNAVEVCRKVIQEGRYALPCCCAVVTIRAKGFSIDRFRRIEGYFLRLAGFSKSGINRRSEFYCEVVEIKGSWLSVLYPATLNPYTLLYYIALTKLLRDKCVKGKRNFKGKRYNGFWLAAFKTWVKVGARRILSKQEYRNFYRRSQVDSPVLLEVLSVR